jgi:hypothetical protein
MSDWDEDWDTGVDEGEVLDPPNMPRMTVNTSQR